MGGGQRRENEGGLGKICHNTFLHQQPMAKIGPVASCGHVGAVPKVAARWFSSGDFWATANACARGGWRNRCSMGRGVDVACWLWWAMASKWTRFVHCCGGRGGLPLPQHNSPRPSPSAIGDPSPSWRRPSPFPRPFPSTLPPL